MNYVGGTVMADIAIDILNLCLMPFRMIDNPVIMVPLAFLTVLGLIGIFGRLLKQ